MKTIFVFVCSSTTLVLLLTLFLPHFTEALLCYSCGTTDVENECITNTKLLQRHNVKYRDGTIDHSRFVANCSSNYRFCGVEKKESDGKLISFIRGCTDGGTFSTTSVTSFFSPDNTSRCFTESSTMYCFSMCEGDFCNGPAHGHNVVPMVTLTVVGLLAAKLMI